MAANSARLELAIERIIKQSQEHARRVKMRAALKELDTHATSHAERLQELLIKFLDGTEKEIDEEKQQRSTLLRRLKDKFPDDPLDINRLHARYPVMLSSKYDADIIRQIVERVDAIVDIKWPDEGWETAPPTMTRKEQPIGSQHQHQRGSFSRAHQEDHQTRANTGSSIDTATSGRNPKVQEDTSQVLPSPTPSTPKVPTRQSPRKRPGGGDDDSGPHTPTKRTRHQIPLTPPDSTKAPSKLRSTPKRDPNRKRGPPTVDDIRLKSLVSSRPPAGMEEVEGVEHTFEFPPGSGWICVIRCPACPQKRFRGGLCTNLTRHFSAPKIASHASCSMPPTDLTIDQVREKYAVPVDGADLQWSQYSNALKHP
ncbi:hypothetical protein F4778DRAFT_787277 [Xylariomycetidae sp. FL2044]|nr:hypothetical protein F4778DRAFT_787277 [Xylariomycetidae sp. FL2044]